MADHSHIYVCQGQPRVGGTVLVCECGDCVVIMGGQVVPPKGR